MTLGGMALAVGLLVDQGIVTLESIFYHLEQGKDIERAILDGAQQIFVPAFVTLLVLNIVFVPMFTLSGVAGFLFSPLAKSAVFSLVASFILSFTLVPTMAKYMLGGTVTHGQAGHGTEGHGHFILLRRSRNPFKRFQEGFEHRFRQFREGYRSLLSLALGRPNTFIAAFLTCVVLSFGLLPFLGENFFPAVDSGQILMHVRAPVGTRIEETARLCDLVERAIRQIIPPEQMDNIVDNIGLPYSGVNMAYNNSGTIGPEDADVLITLKENHSPTADFIKDLRTLLPQKFTGATFAFLPADITSQILNFGLPAPIDVQIVGPNREASFAFATDLSKRIRMVPGIADPRIQQAFDYPQINVDVDRSFAGMVGLTQRDVANSLLITLSGSGQVKPNFWLNTQNGVSYPIVVQSPQYWMDSLSDLVNLPITSPATKTPRLLGSLASITPGPSAAIVSHYNVQPVIDVFAAVQGRDLGAVAKDVNRVLNDAASSTPRGTHVVVRGQVQTMSGAYAELFRACWCNCAGLFDHRRQFSILARSIHHHYRFARGSCRHCLDAVLDGDDPVHTGPNRCYHVHGDRHGQRCFGGQLWPREARGRL